MSTPRVTLGLPVFNGLPFLRDTLASLRAQTFTDFELVVADNASTDGTRDIIEELAQQDSRVRLLRSDVNHGAAWNYNRILEGTAAPYFKWAAADDLLEPRYLEATVAALDAHPEAVLAYPRTTIIDADGRSVGPYDDRMHLTHRDPVRRFGAMVRSLRECNAVFGLIRRSALERTGLIGSYSGSDLILLGELVLQGAFHEVPDALFLRRDHPAQSVRAHADLEERNAWFDTAQAGAPSSPMWRLYREYRRLLRHAGWTTWQRTRGEAALAFWWARNKYPELASEAWRACRSRVSHHSSR